VKNYTSYPLNADPSLKAKSKILGIDKVLGIDAGIQLVVPSAWTAHQEYNIFEKIVGHFSFEYVSAILLIVGACLECLAAVDDHQHPLLKILSTAFVFAFVFEVALKLCAARKAFFKGPEGVWNIYDSLLVSLLFAILVVDLIAKSMDAGNEAQEFIKLGEMVRLWRVLRILKCLKLSATFQEILTKTTYSLRFFWVLAPVTMLLYVVAVNIAHGRVHLGGEQVGKHFDFHQLDEAPRLI